MMRLHKRYTISQKRQDAISKKREGEDGYQSIARQIAMTKPYEGTVLYLMRSPKPLGVPPTPNVVVDQRPAWEFYQAAQSVRWNRFAVFAAVLGTFVNGALIIIFK